LIPVGSLTLDGNQWRTIDHLPQFAAGNQWGLGRDFRQSLQGRISQLIDAVPHPKVTRSNAQHPRAPPLPENSDDKTLPLESMFLRIFGE